MLLPVILSGGMGSGLWPVSRAQFPKPFIKLADGQSMLQKTFLRAANIPHVTTVMTATNENLFFLTQDEYKDIAHTQPKLTGNKTITLEFMLEPVGRNTAAAVACSALEIIEQHGGDTMMLVLSADHLIDNIPQFEDAVQRAVVLAEQGRVVMLGVTPTTAETDYGYIQAEGTKVKRFVEKPNAETAQRYIDAGDYLWNAGIFCFRADVIIEEFKLYAPELLEKVQAALEEKRQNNSPHLHVTRLDKSTFSRVPHISIDYSIMEYSKKISVVACDMGWRDIGSWETLGKLTEADEQGNRISAKSTLHDTYNCLIRSDTNRMIGAVGVSDLMIIDTPDALLVADRQRADDVKMIVAKLRAAQDDTCRLHQTVNRPWGTSTIIEEGKHYKMKRLVLKPGQQISLQIHHHRSEHWIALSGVATVLKGNKTLLLHPHESVYIPAGEQHKLSNPSVVDCILIEVQVGEYVDEDDIIRLETTSLFG